ncbi:MAG: LysE family translocator [Candidatus Binataceae bacterium]
MSFDVWLVFLLTETALCLIPGPAVLFVLTQGLTRGALASLWASLGILAGNTFYFLLSATGLGAILVTSYDLFFAIKWMGAAYLIWLGLRTLFGRPSAFAVPAADAPAVSARRLFANGFAVQVSNPKALIFFTALLPQFVDPTHSIVTQVAILAATSVSVEFAVLVCYGGLAGRLSRIATLPQFATLTNRVAGAMLITAGAGIATLRRA